MTNAEKEREALMLAYRAAFAHAYGKPANIRFNGRRYCVGRAYFTRAQLERATERLNARPVAA